MSEMVSEPKGWMSRGWLSGEGLMSGYRIISFDASNTSACDRLNRHISAAN